MQFFQLPSAAPLYSPESHQRSEISSLPKVILVLGKVRSHRVPNPRCRGTESPGWFDVSPKCSAQDAMHEWAHCHDEAANNQLLIAVAFWITWIVSEDECSSLAQNLKQIYCCTQSITLKAMATQYTCSLNNAYCPHWCVRWSRHCPPTCIPVHSPWLLGYTNIA